MRPSLFARITTARALGLGNVARVISYRLRLRAGIHPVQRLAPATPPHAPFFVTPDTLQPLPVPQAWQATGNYFGWYRPDLAPGPPDWHRNAIDGTRATRTHADWWTIPDFDPALGDIKTVWEASRFDWVVNLAQHARAGTPGATLRLNAWLDDWCTKNPPYVGHNWKCAQEASIRVMHLALAALILDETRTPQPSVVELLTAHLRRIAPTVSYAIAQDNNHGTSEAAALFIGGSWLDRLGRSEGLRWQRQGRALLENRVPRLIQPDGTFSQYSVNYHRLMLDTLSLAEVWRRHLALPALSDVCRMRASAATAWLRAMVDPVTGDAPNFGANDGSNLLPLTDADYRDFRPAVQLATALFEQRSAFSGVGSWQAHLGWLGVLPGPEMTATPVSTMFDDGGQAVLRSGAARAILRYPRFRFRPSHADALHVDLWLDGENVLRDGGSVSYAADQSLQDNFVGVRGHNAVQFDDRDQMPRLGRFLWGCWLTTDALEPVHASESGNVAGASYRDAWGAVHARRVKLMPHCLTVTDRVSGFASRAIVRWRLRPTDWHLDGNVLTDGNHQLRVSANVPVVRRELVTGWESRYYLRTTEIPVLEIELAVDGTVTSTYRWTG